MTTINPGEGYLLLEEGTMQEASDEFFSRRSQSWRPVYNVGLPVKRGEHVRRRETTVTTSGPYVAIEVHRAALKEIDRLQWELRDSKVWWKKEIERLKAELEAIKQPLQNPSKTPQPGQYWIHDKSGDKAYFIGKCPADIMVWQIEGDDIEHGSLDWSGWHHEPRCTGWDWKPSPEPEWFDLTPFEEHVLRRLTDSVSKGFRFAEVDALEGITVSEAKRLEFKQFRCLLKDAPPELVAKASKPAENAYGFCPICGAPGVFRERRLNGNDRCSNGHEYWSKNAKLNRPAEDPDEWVTQDRVPARRGIDERRWKNRYDAPDDWGSCEGLAEDAYHGMTTGSGHRLELRCRRRDLPPMPDKPKTEREVSLYWYDGNVVGRYADCPPDDPSFVPLIFRDGKVFVEIETQEVVR